MTHLNIVIALMALAGQTLAKPFAPSSAISANHRRLASTDIASSSSQSYWPPMQGDSAAPSSTGTDPDPNPFVELAPTTSCNEVVTGRQSYWPPSPRTLSSTSAHEATTTAAAPAAVAPEVNSPATFPGKLYMLLGHSLSIFLQINTQYAESQFEKGESASSVSVAAPKGFAPTGKSYTPWDNAPPTTRRPGALNAGVQSGASVVEQSLPPVPPTMGASPGKSYTPWGSGSATKAPRTSVKLYASPRSYTPWDSGPTPGRREASTPIQVPPASTSGSTSASVPPPSAPSPAVAAPVASATGASGSKSYWPPSPGRPSSSPRTAAMPPPTSSAPSTPTPAESVPLPQTLATSAGGASKGKSYTPWDNARPSTRAQSPQNVSPSPESTPAQNSGLSTPAPSPAPVPSTQSYASPPGSKSYWPPLLGARK